MDFTPEQYEMHKKRAQLVFIQQRGAEFFQTIMFNLNWIDTDKVRGLKTDGINIYANPSDLMSITPHQLAAKYLDIALHVGLRHAERAYQFQSNPNGAKVFSQACDLANNLTMERNGFTLPPDAQIDHRFDSCSEESIYSTLLEELPPQSENDDGQGDNGDGDGNGSNGSGNGNGGGSGEGNSPWNDDLMPAQSEAQQQQVSQSHDDLIGRAVVAAQMAGGDSVGNVPGEILRAYEEKLNPKQDWQSLLQHFVSGFNKDDYSMRRPNMNYFPDYYMPSLYSESIGKVLIFIDVSGSIGQKELDVFFGEIQGIRDQYPVSELQIIGFDTKLTAINHIQIGDELDQVVLNGGGGTDIRPVVDYIMQEEPEFALIFTDGYFSKYEPEGYDTPTLWLIHDSEAFETNLGEVVYHDTRLN